MRITAFLRATHAFIRPPHFRSIPSTGPNGAVINRDALMHQFQDFYATLKQSTLIDRLTIMSERSTFESCKVADQLVSIGPSFVGMPLAGNEHRATEFMETMRYIRNGGGPSTVATYLQDADDARAHSGDIVMLPTGIAVGSGPRTNNAAFETLQSLFEIDDEHAPFRVTMLEQEGDCPPLGDYFGFAGDNILLAWKDEHGLLAVEQFQKDYPELANQVQVVYLEPGCHFLTFYGADMANDVLVMRGFDRSNDALAGAGLNPIPVHWSEMDKMGVSMRSCVLMLRLLKTNTAGLLSRNKVRGSRWQAHQIE